MPIQSAQGHNGLLSAQSLDGLLISQPHYANLYKDFTAHLDTERAKALSELNQAVLDKASDSDKKPLLDQVWNLTRRRGISGTNASVILGQNKYKTPYELYNELTGRVIPAQKDNVYMEWGRRLEDVVAQKYSDQHQVRLTPVETFVSSAFPFMTASVDRLIVDNNNSAKGVLELKTAGFNLKTVDEDGEVERVWGPGNQYINVRNADGSETLQLVQADSQCPANYFTQVLHYMVSTGVYQGHLAVLIGGRDYREYEIPFDYAAAESLVRAEDEFFCKHVLDDVAPAMTAKELGTVVPEKKSAIEATPDIVAKAQKLKELTAKMASLKVEADSLKDSLIEYVGTNENITVNDKPIVSYSSCKGRVSVDIDALKDAYTQLAIAANIEPQEFTKQGAAYRRFSIKIKD